MTIVKIAFPWPWPTGSWATTNSLGHGTRAVEKMANMKPIDKFEDYDRRLFQRGGRRIAGHKTASKLGSRPSGSSVAVKNSENGQWGSRQATPPPARTSPRRPVYARVVSSPLYRRPPPQRKPSGMTFRPKAIHSPFRFGQFRHQRNCSFQPNHPCADYRVRRLQLFHRCGPEWSIRRRRLDRPVDFGRRFLSSCQSPPGNLGRPVRVTLATSGNSVGLVPFQFDSRVVSAPLGADNTTLYLSFLMQRTNGKASETEGVGLSLQGSKNTIFIGVPGTSGSDTWEWPLEGAFAATSVPVGNAATLLVGRVDFGPSGEVCPSVHQPVAGSTRTGFGVSDVRHTRDGHAVRSDYFGGRSATEESYTYDELLLGSSLASVTPVSVPEPR